MELYQWRTLDSTGRVQMLSYSFGPATANTLAIRTDDGSFLVISPSARTPAAALDAIAAQGPVSALLAPNGFHHMGQAEWRKRFPEAISYGPDDALARLAKQSGVAYQPASALAGRLGPHLQVIRPAGLRASDLLVHASLPEGAFWFSGDVLSNMPPGEGGRIYQALVRLTGGKPGYGYNTLIGLMFVKNKAEWKADVRAHMARERLAAVIPAHGEPATGEVVARTQELLQ